MSKQVRTKLYELLYSWNRFKIDDNIKADLKDKVNEILKVVNHKEE